MFFLHCVFAFAITGSIDPWHALSVLTNQSATELSIFIPGTSHCANMGSDQPSDPPALRQARQVCKFLDHPVDVRNCVSLPRSSVE